METEKKNGGLLSCIEYGLYAGMLMIVAQLLIHFLGSPEGSVGGWGTTLLGIFLMAFFMWQYREKEAGADFGYGKALGKGTLIGLFMAIVLALYYYLYLRFMAPGLLDSLLQETRFVLEEQGYEGEQLKTMMEIYEAYFFVPAGMSIGSFFSHFFWNFLTALVAAAFLKRSSGNG